VLSIKTKPSGNSIKENDKKDVLKVDKKVLSTLTSGTKPHHHSNL